MTDTIFTDIQTIYDNGNTDIAMLRLCNLISGSADPAVRTTAFQLFEKYMADAKPPPEPVEQIKKPAPAQVRKHRCWPMRQKITTAKQFTHELYRYLDRTDQPVPSPVRRIVHTFTIDIALLFNGLNDEQVQSQLLDHIDRLAQDLIPVVSGPAVFSAVVAVLYANDILARGSARSLRKHMMTNSSQSFQDDD